MLRYPLLLTCLTAPAASQGSPSPGLTLYAADRRRQYPPRGRPGQRRAHLVEPHAPGLAVYLLEDGDLLRTEHPPGAAFAPGAGGRIRRYSFDGTLEWTFDYFENGVLQHHDVEPMPNGNVLLVAWEDVPVAEAVEQGRDPSTVLSDVFQPVHVVEVQPTGPTSGAIVWEWHAWDHLIQDFDPTKPNFGVVADHPELIDLNYPNGPELTGDWLHVNSIDYNAELDQILLSVHDTDEIWVIDHSTTTAEAAGHTGGNSGKGGDLLYRWGNPAAYDTGPAAAHVLDRQHDANWVEPGFPGAGNIVLIDNYNGAFPNFFSRVIELEPPVDELGNYAQVPGTAFGPTSLVWEYTAPVPSDFFTANQGGAIRLANGNTLITSTTQNRLFEVDPSGATVWEKTAALQVFKARRYEHHLWAASNDASLASGASIALDLLAGSDHAGELAFLLGSASGTTPGFPLDGHVLPLSVADAYFLLTLAGNGLVAPPLSVLGATGNASAAFTLPAGLDPALAGAVLHHAFVALDPVLATVELASNAVAIELVP